MKIQSSVKKLQHTWVTPALHRKYHWDLVYRSWVIQLHSQFPGRLDLDISQCIAFLLRGSFVPSPTHGTRAHTPRTRDSLGWSRGQTSHWARNSTAPELYERMGQIGEGKFQRVTCDCVCILTKWLPFKVLSLCRNDNLRGQIYYFLSVRKLKWCIQTSKEDLVPNVVYIVFVAPFQKPWKHFHGLLHVVLLPTKKSNDPPVSNNYHEKRTKRYKDDTDAERYCTVTKLTIRVLRARWDFFVKSPLHFFQCYHLLLNPPWTHDSVCENNFLIGMKWENLCVWSLLLEEVCNENWRVPRILIFPTWAKQN